MNSPIKPPGAPIREKIMDGASRQSKPPVQPHTVRNAVSTTGESVVTLRATSSRALSRLIATATSRGDWSGRGARIWNWIFIGLLLSPTLMGFLYFGFIATDRYVSEATFVVRSSKQGAGANGFSAFLKMVGASDSQDDSFAVHEFITSRDAIVQMSEYIDLKAKYGYSGADNLSRFPNLFYGASIDEFEKYLKSRITVFYNPNNGLGRLSVQAFTAQDSADIAKLLLQLSERLVNRMNNRIQDDALRIANDEVQRAQTNLKDKHLQITMFRNREIQIDPNRSSTLVMELVGKLTEELSTTQARMSEVSAASPNSPELGGLKRRANALREEISNERRRVTDGSDGLALKISEYESLLLEREFAARMLGQAITSLETARVEARRQQLYLELITGPSLPDKPMMPERIANVLSILAINLILILIAWLIITGVRERMPNTSHIQ